MFMNSHIYIDFNQFPLIFSTAARNLAYSKRLAINLTVLHVYSIRYSQSLVGKGRNPTYSLWKFISIPLD